MARLRSAPTTQPAPTKTSTRQALKEKTNTTGVGAPTAREPKDFVKDARTTRGRPRKAVQDEDELVMAGGLGQKSDSPASEVPTITDELAKSDGPPRPTAKANRRPPRQARKPAQSEAQSKVFEDMKKRMRATAHEEAGSDQIVDVPATASDRAGPSSDALPTKPPPGRVSNAAAAERSEFSISPSPPPPGKLSAVKNKRSSIARPESVLKSQSTPAAEASVLALKNFKRRPRQPSMLAMVRQRAGARPSASHIQQAMEVEPEDPSVFDIDAGDEDEEFAPDAEGTPLHLRKAKRASAVSKTAASPISHRKSALHVEVRPKKRKSDEADVSSSSLSALRAKRQRLRLSGAALDREPLGSSERQGTPLPQVTSDVQVINSSPSTTPPTEPSSTDRRQCSPGAEVVVPSTEEQNQPVAEQQIPLNDTDNYNDQAAPNETMADPMSSSPLPEHPRATQAIDIMAEPLTQLTPSRPVRDKEKAEKKAQRMMTSTLQSLLPKRRQPLQPRRRKSEYDIDSSSDEGDAGGEDDSADDAAVARSRRRTKNPSMKNRKSTAKGKVSNATRKSAANQSTRKSTAAKKKVANGGKSTQTKTTRTYGRNAASDKENDPANSDFEELSDNDDSALPDTSLTVHEVAQQSGELAAAKAKFAEVDGWDMELESVSFEEGRSSSQTWR